MKKAWFLTLGGCVIVVGSVACSTADSDEALATGESAYSPIDEADCDGGTEIVIPYVDPDLNYSELPGTPPSPTADAGPADDDDDDVVLADAGVMPVPPSPPPAQADAGITIVQAPVNPMPADGGIKPADRPRLPPKPPVCKPPKKTNCSADNEALKPECRGGKKDALYKKQKEICGQERSCKATDTPAELETKLKRNQHCKDLRVQVRNCYIDKCQAGHVIAITEAIAAMANCQYLISNPKK